MSEIIVRLRLCAGLLMTGLFCLCLPKPALRQCLGYISNRFTRFRGYDT